MAGNITSVYCILGLFIASNLSLKQLIIWVKPRYGIYRKNVKKHLTIEYLFNYNTVEQIFN